MKKKVYTVLVENFREWGVEHVFGIPGKSISPLMLEVNSKGIEYVLSRHEAGAGFEAAGYALMKKTVGIAIGTSGPGGTNFLTAAAQAKEHEIPVLFITGHPSMQETGQALGQDSSHFGVDLVKMFEPVTNFSGFVSRGDLLHSYLHHALEKAWTGTKGPVHLCIPFDVLMEEIETFLLPLPNHVSSVISSGLEQVISLLNEARKPVLFIGKGTVAAEAYEEVRILAEHWRIPVITAPGGKGAFPTFHPLCLGGFGLGGTEKASNYLRSGVDVMVVVGSRLCDMDLSGFDKEMYPEKVVQFEQDLTFIGKSIPVPTYPVLGDIRQNLRQVIEKAGASSRDDDDVPVIEIENMNAKSAGLLSAVQAIKSLRSSLPEDAVLFGDAGSHTFYAVRHYDIYKPGTFYLDEVFLAMGHAIGYAIGAKTAAPEKVIACITGDGCMMMHGTEISTAVNHRIPVLFIVLNNGRLDMVDKGMSYNTGRSVGAVYDVPLNVSKFAQSMGAYAACCHTENDIREAIASALKANGPTVIEIMVNPMEVPPILTRLLTMA
jgi:acetolactate synthase-1/2/3 large subunit